jgi:glycosyltransferase involved in cell wall biosynthesis
MHIVVNALLVAGEFSGVQHAILHQLRALLNSGTHHRISVLALRDVPIDVHLGPTRRQPEILRAPLRTNERLHRIIWEQMALPGVLASSRADLLYAPGYLTTLRWRGPSVVFIHDTIALSHPRLCRASNALNYRLLLPPSAQHATRVAVPSHASAADVMRYCRVSPARIRVIPHGVICTQPPGDGEMLASHQHFGIDVPYLLAVSTIEPKKNFDGLIRWFDEWKDAGIPHRLVIAGKWGWRSGTVRRALTRARHRDHIQLCGYVPQHQLPPLMAGADLLLMPSHYEGFGLPVLEAMANGVPVVVSDRGALPETAGTAACVLPLVDARWLEEIPRLLRDGARRQAMREAGLVRAAACSWDAAAQQLLELFDESVAHHTAMPRSC